MQQWNLGRSRMAAACLQSAEPSRMQCHVLELLGRQKELDMSVEFVNRTIPQGVTQDLMKSK